MSAVETALCVEPSPLHDRAAELCRTNQWVRIGRLTLVDVYTSIEEEYWALKADAALSDLSAKRTYRVRGPEALIALDHLVARRLDGMKPGEQQDALWCSDAGFVLGHGSVLRESEDTFLIVTDEPGLGWIDDTISGFECQVRDETRNIARIGVQGPAAMSVLDAIGLTLARQLEPMKAVLGTLRGLRIGVARRDTERFELWVGAAEVRVLWDRLMMAGRPMGLKPAGVAAQTVVRLEIGEPKLGVDFHGASRARFPAELVRPEAIGLNALIDGSKAQFVGHAALATALPSQRRLIRLLAETTEPLTGAIISGKDQKPAGYLTSWGYAPALGASLAYGWLEGLSAEGIGLVLPPNAGSGGKLRQIACRIA